MSFRRLLLLSAGAVTGLAALSIPAAAQACFGRASLPGRAMVVGGSYERTDVLDSRVASTLGVRGRYLLGIAAGDETRPAGRTRVVDALGGLQLPLGGPTRMSACSFIAIGVGTGPNDVGATGSEFSMYSYSAGTQIGWTAWRGPGLSIVPTFGAVTINARSRQTVGGVVDRDADVYGYANVGLGITVRNVLSVVPAVRQPLMLKGVKPSFALDVALALGGRR